MRSCDQCQAVVAEFEPVARAFGEAAPAVEPPGDLETRTLAVVQGAAMAASQPEFYECWYAGPDDRPGHPQLITVGTFVSGDGTVTMSSAADPAKFQIMRITIEHPGDAGQHGQVILQGKARLS